MEKIPPWREQRAVLQEMTRTGSVTQGVERLVKEKGVRPKPGCKTEEEAEAPPQAPRQMPHFFRSRIVSWRFSPPPYVFLPSRYTTSTMSPIVKSPGTARPHSNRRPATCFSRLQKELQVAEVLPADQLALNDPHAAGKKNQRRVSLPVRLEEIHGLLQIRGKIRGRDLRVDVDGLLSLRGRAISSTLGKEGVQEWRKPVLLDAESSGKVMAAVGEELPAVTREEIRDDVVPIAANGADGGVPPSAMTMAGALKKP